MPESLFLIKFHTYKLKKYYCTGIFMWVLQNISERFFVKNFWVTASAKYSYFLLYVDLSHKRFLQTWLFQIFSRQTQCMVCEQLFVKVLDRQLWLSWFIANGVSDVSKILLEIGSSHPAVFCKNEIL